MIEGVVLKTDDTRERYSQKYQDTCFILSVKDKTKQHKTIFKIILLGELQKKMYSTKSHTQFVVNWLSKNNYITTQVVFLSVLVTFKKLYFW